ncbi:DUF411 domain-containing protein [Onishia niordana]|uniref:DUF411 domain-containing protein n=1 Tax=Onishia niordana TaxID=2508711 RepID=UPI0010A0B019|nr:DUF411 domain-containing protein [Halomonas niordiana]
MQAQVKVLYLAGSLLLGASTAHAALPDSARLFKNPSCGCCEAYARHLEASGIDVEIIDDEPMGEIKHAAGIPYGQGSCHTVMIEGYVIEGHVPVAALERLFEQRPDIDGIGLAGMPQGTPGMPGPQRAPYEVYQFTDGQATPFMTL